MKKVLIDPGHGGHDSGAVANGIREKDLNLQIALTVGDVLQKKYLVSVSYSRVNDVWVSLRERITIANNMRADLFVSFHSNAFTNRAANGYEDFISLRPMSSSILTQNVIHDELSIPWEQHNRANRGKKQANFAVLRMAKVPAVLVEQGFLTNEIDAKLLKDTKFLENLIKASVKGVAKALRLTSRAISYD